MSSVLLVWILFAVLVLPPISAQQPTGFLNIDCGVSNAVGYQNPLTGLKYEGDARYISTGKVGSSSSTTPDDLDTVRYFPAGSSPVKNCYQVPVANNTQYLVRVWFYFGSYAVPPPSGLVNFTLALGTTVWRDVSIDTTSGLPYAYEAMLISSQANVSVCLIRKNDGGDPFISTLELRPQSSVSYLARFSNPQGSILTLLRRRNYGEQTTTYRYPDDVYDRLWRPYATSYASLLAPGYPTATQTIFYNNSVQADFPPKIVMQSAMTDPNQISYTLDISPFLGPRVYVSLFFAETQVLPPGTRRVMDIVANFFSPPTSGADHYVFEVASYVPPFTVVQLQERPAFQLPASTDSITFTINKSSISSANPFVSAFEAYVVVDLAPGADAGDVMTLNRLKNVIGFGQWTGDPCLPAAWDELGCTNGRVTSLNLSGKDLQGPIPAVIADLTALITLNLSNNNFTGPLPNWVGQLNSLTTLDVSNNELSGSFPASYFTQIANFTYSGNPQLTCAPTNNLACPATPPTPRPPAGVSPSGNPPSSLPSKHKKTSIVPIVAGIGGGVLLVVLIAVISVCCCFCIRRPAPVQKDLPNLSQFDPAPVAPSGHETPIRASAAQGQAQAYSLHAIRNATNNFARKLGEGGFGPVYYGILNGSQEVAVKVMSGKTQQGFSEFANEIELLSTVHYKKLVSLVGYCQEGTDLIVLYEYMAGGDLRSHLYGPLAAASPLSWRQRLQLTLDAAKGLEYLHHGCNHPIIHRDVKSSNILLDSKLTEAKVADFGLSKLTSDGQTHVVTMVKGSLGYLDPDYHSTGMLTDRSDVFSFGVVMLEVLCGQPPVSKDNSRKSLAEQVRTATMTGYLQAVVDPSLRGDYRMESVWRYVEVAMGCVAVAPGARPKMSKVVAGLMTCMEIEFGGLPGAYNSDPSHSSHSDPSSHDPDPPSQIFFADQKPRAY